MPDDNSAAWAVASSLMNTAATSWASGEMNKRAEKFNWKMYEQQREDSLSDWATQNEFNSPRAQMQRLQAGGLNPNLVYGNGADATSAAMPRASTMNAPNYKMGDYNVGDALNKYMSLKTNNAQMDNLAAQRTLLEKEATLKDAQTIDTYSRVSDRSFDLTQKDRLKDISAQAAQMNIDKIANDISATANRDLRENQLHPGRLQEQTLQLVQEGIKANTIMPKQAEILQQQLTNMKKDATIKDFEIMLNDAGFTKNDEWYWRILNKVAQVYRGAPKGEKPK